MYITWLATTVLATACLGGAAPLDEVRDPAAAAAFAEVFARLDAVEAELGVERQGRVAAEARAAALLQRLKIFDGPPGHNTSVPYGSGGGAGVPVGATYYDSGNVTRREMQQVPTGSCRNPAQVSARSQSVMRACCSRGKGGHRRLQARCKKLPGTCGTMKCAAAFVGFFDDCSSVLNKGEFRRFYAGCKELQAQSKRMLLQPVSVQMFKVAIATKPPPSAVSPGPPPPSKPHSSPPPPPAPCLDDRSFKSFGGTTCKDARAKPKTLCRYADTRIACARACGQCQSSSSPPPPHASAVQEYHAVCSSATIETCVPTCNATHHGYVLLATIDGTDTKFSCNVAHGLYSWVGAASEGGYLGVDFQAFFSAVSSGAAGNYLVTMIAAAGISTALTIRAGQIVSINGGGSGKGERKFTTAAAAAAPPPRSLLRRHPYNNSNNNIRHTGHT